MANSTEPTSSGGSERKSPVVDAHHHYWQISRQTYPFLRPEHGVLRRDFEPEEHRRDLSSAGVDATILVESFTSREENGYLAEYAATESTVAGVVGWLPVSDVREAREMLAQVKEIPKLVGIRHQVGATPLSWLAEPDAVDLFDELAEYGLCWDIVPINDE